MDPPAEAEVLPKEPSELSGYGFMVSHQVVDLEIDFSTKNLKGRTQIKILPQAKTLSVIKIDASQCAIAPNGVLVNGTEAEYDYEDPYEAVAVPAEFAWRAEHWQHQKNRLNSRLFHKKVANGALEITIPDSVRIEEVDPFSGNADTAVSQRAAGAAAVRHSSNAIEPGPLSATPVLTPKLAAEQASKFQPLTITISFTTKSFRDGLHFVGLDEGDTRYPHVYTLHFLDPGIASCIFPCVDDAAMRCTWEFNIRCSGTLGDSLKKKPAEHSHKPGHHHHHHKQPNGIPNGLANGVNHNVDELEENEVLFTDAEKLIEMVVVCSGEQTQEIVDVDDSSKKVVTFRCDKTVAPQHIGFAIGPFQQIDLTEFREDEDDEKLGQGQTIPISGYCLPGREDELRHTCLPMAHALDYFLLNFGAFPFTEYKLVFVEDLKMDTEVGASMALCSTRLLFSPDILDPEIENTRKLVHTIASQWVGVSIVPNLPQDRWVVIGISHYMTNLFMKTLCGNNEFAFRQKAEMDRLVKMDINRPSLTALGRILSFDASEYEFMELKAPLVLFILDKRIIKERPGLGLQRVISKIIVNANTREGSGDFLSSDDFCKTCEKITRFKGTEDLWNHFVHGAGCPIFNCQHKFSKKKSVIEFILNQTQSKNVATTQLQKESFWREAKEKFDAVESPSVQSVFKADMTLRVHGVDGNAVEHIIKISTDPKKQDLEHSNKYKRLKRNRRAKERLTHTGGAESENQDDIQIYCLGDVLQTPTEMEEWDLAEWDQDMEQKMDAETYEWLRVDAEFEWLCDMNFTGQASYMYTSQLQQDRDVVAQYESLVWLRTCKPHPMLATLLIRTLMDRRYFHGIRTLAADALKEQTNPPEHGLKLLEKAFQEMFCYPSTKTPRPNDFSDKEAYFIECSIQRAISHVRDNKGKCPKNARQFLLEQLRFNDNTNNEFSDNFKIANLLSALAESLIPGKKNEDAVQFEEEDEEEEAEFANFRKTVIEELDRYRRIDEWLSSYQNIYTVTVLECKHNIMRNKVIPIDPLEFAQYLHDGTADVVRIKAFEALADLGFLKQSSFSCLLLNVLSTDSSPYVRKRLFDAFCIGLATVAFGEHKPSDSQAPVEADDLIVEQEAVLEDRQSNIARTTNLTDALAALKEEFKSDELLKTALWEAVKSPAISASEQMELLNICKTLYNPTSECILKLRRPRHWTAHHLGHAKLHFKKDGPLRKPTLKRKREATPVPEPMQPPAKRISIKASTTSKANTTSISVVPAKADVTPNAPPPPKSTKRPLPEDEGSVQDDQGQRPRKIIKWKTKSNVAEKIEKIQSVSPSPSKPKKKGARQGQSPALKTSKASKARVDSPTPSTITVSPVTIKTEPATIAVAPVASPAKIRKPLPDSAPSVPAPTPPVKKPSISIKLKVKPSGGGAAE